MGNSWTKKSLLVQAEGLSARQISSEELTRAYLREIEARDGALGAYLTLTAERAITAARASDARRARGDALGILDGIPFAAKDNLCTEDIPTTCGSRMLSNYLPPYDATVIERLTLAGGILLGKTNLDEFGMGSSTEYSAYHPTRNPRDPSRTAGGSSGGSAAAVAAAMASFAIGSDTGGSVRQPAAFCGLFGMKPTYGRVSRYGLVSFASSLEQVGVLTKTAEDNAAVLSVLAGQDPRDATTSPCDVPDLSAGIGEGIEGLRIGVLAPELLGALSPDVADALSATVERCERAGARIVSISPDELSAFSYATEAYYLISSAEASSNLARFDGVRYGMRAEGANEAEELYRRSRTEGFGAEVKRRLLLGTFALSAGYYEQYYGKARSLAERLRAQMRSIFSGCDLLLLPTAPTAAYPLGEKTRGDDPTLPYGEDRFTVLANLTGLPALSFPAGENAEGLPVGLQLMADAFCEPLLYRGARSLADTNREEEGKA